MCKQQKKISPDQREDFLFKKLDDLASNDIEKIQKKFSIKSHVDYCTTFQKKSNNIFRKSEILIKKDMKMY
jgi:hypothetical protein